MSTQGTGRNHRPSAPGYRVTPVTPASDDDEQKMQRDASWVNAGPIEIANPGETGLKKHLHVDKATRKTRPARSISGDWRLYLASLTLVWLVLFSMTLGGWQPGTAGASPVGWIILAILHVPFAFIILWLSFGLMERIGYIWSGRSPRSPGRLPMETPAVCVQLPMFNEAAVARRIIEAAAALDWPKGRLTIQVLDDSTDPAIQDMVRGVCDDVSRETGIPCAWIHRANRAGYKAGALEAGRHLTDAEFIAIFDADFLPPHDFLRNAMPHFFEVDGAGKPELALVQAQWGHLNDDESLLTAAQALWVDDHHTLQKSWRSAVIHFVNFTGTAGVWRASAIQAAGGWRSASLVEDCELSMRVLFAGYQTRFVKEVVAPAELPQTFAAYRLQQKRWTQGWAQLQRLHMGTLLFNYRRPWLTKIYLTYFMGISWQWPLWASWITIFPFLITHGLWFGSSDEVVGSMIYFLPPSIFALVATLLATIETRRTYANRADVGSGRVRRFLRVFPYLFINAGMLPHHVCAFLEGLFGPMHAEFERTPKTAAVSAAQGQPRISPGARRATSARKPNVRVPYLLVELFFIVTQSAWMLVFAARGHYVAAAWAGWLAGCIACVGLGPLVLEAIRNQRSASAAPLEAAC